EGATRRARLAGHVAALADALAGTRFAPRAPSPIVPIVLGPDRAALSAALTLRAEGLFTQAIRPPTVAEGTARLRITLSAAHDPADIARLARALAALPSA